MSNSLGTKLDLEIKLINFKMSKTWLALVQTLKLLTTFYLHTKKIKKTFYHKTQMKLTNSKEKQLYSGL